MTDLHPAIITPATQLVDEVPCQPQAGSDTDDAACMTSSDTGTAGDAIGQGASETDHTAEVRLATVLASRNRVRDALDVLQPILARSPTHVPALSLQGRCLAALGNRPEAIASFATALATDPHHIPTLLGCAALYKDAGLVTDALALLDTAFKVAPTDPDVRAALALSHTDVGTHAKCAGLDGWLAHYERAVEVCPSYAPAHYNLGVAAAERGDQTAALERYSRAVELRPSYAEAWCNMGAVYKGQGELEVAVRAYKRAAEVAPASELIASNLAVALTEQGTRLKTAGDVDAAVKCYERALAARPRHAEALYNLGVTFTEQGLNDKAIFMYETAIAAAPQCAEAHNNLGVLFRELGNGERAIRAYAAALDIRPNFPQALNNLAVMYTQGGRAADALGLLHAALMAAPDYAEAHNNLGVLQRDVGDVHAALSSYSTCLALDPPNRNAGQNSLLGMNYVYHGEEAVVSGAHEAWGRRFQALHPLLPPVTPQERVKAAGDPLIVGYVSPDFFTHSVSYFAEAPLRHHDVARVRHIVYSCCPKGDAKTERMKAAVKAGRGEWREVTRLGEAELANLMREDQLDLLVELTGHTANNRLGALARRPAPLQLTWIGYPNSTGLTTIDYRLTDAIADPTDTSQTFTEELVRLPGCFLCYTPPIDAPPVAPLPALDNGFVTFGSFNALAKETPEVMRVWARILLSVPHSRLVLKNKPFACDSVRCRYWAAFEELGVSAQRVDLLPLVAATSDHLGQYAMLDISLDPWPYAGTTTTTESLYMGVPCLTLAGKCHAHNVGKSLLTAVGLQGEWVAGSIDEYVERAVMLAGDVAGLAALRAGLRDRMLESRLCDGARFTQELEETYWGLWDRWQGKGGGTDK